MSLEGKIKTTFAGIVHNSNNPDKLPLAQVFVPELHGGLAEDDYDNLPWWRIDLGAGSGSGTDSTGFTLQTGQKVEVTMDENDITVYHITKKLPYASAVNPVQNNNPNTVQPLQDNNKNLHDAFKNPGLVDEPIARMITADLTKLSGTIFGKFNNEIVNMIGKGLLDLQKNINPFTDLLAFLLDPGAWEPEIAGLTYPVLTVGINDAIDLTKDMSRMVDRLGGTIGNVASMIKVDGWKAKAKDWEYIPASSSSPIQITSTGEISIQPNLNVGFHSGIFTIRSRDIDWAVVDALPTEAARLAAMAAIATVGDYAKIFTISSAVVNDLSKLDFSQSINFLDSMPPAEIGPQFESALMPKIEFTLDKKTTDLAEFGQLHVITGTGNKTASLEIDMSRSVFTKKGNNKKV